MEFKEAKLNIFASSKMFDIKKFQEAEPDVFDDLCKDYPMDEQAIYMIAVKKENGKKKGVI